MSACLGSVDFRGSVLREALLAVAGRSLFVVRDVKIFLVLFCVALMLVVCLAFSFLLRYRFLIVINRGGRVVATFGCVRRRFATFAAPARKKKKNLDAARELVGPRERLPEPDRHVPQRQRVDHAGNRHSRGAHAGNAAVGRVARVAAQRAARRLACSSVSRPMRARARARILFMSLCGAQLARVCVILIRSHARTRALFAQLFGAEALL